ncbi:class I SAM-dependent methyltransferase [Dactylosporangium sp. CA-233914]|uniref:class I SAM-dependent methyltransferase n=1 Tax=Dactylosporangium sp. CA-233914 TaxID=3239934 RepID=UPI003D93DB28
MTQRWTEVLNLVTHAVIPGPATIVVDGTDPEAVASTTARLATALREAGTSTKTTATHPHRDADGETAPAGHPAAAPQDTDAGRPPGATIAVAETATADPVTDPRTTAGAKRTMTASRDADASPPAATIAVAGGGPRVLVWLRTSRDRHTEEAARGDAADIVVDLHDRAWPVVRHIAPRLLDHGTWYLRESRAFFGVRAATWDSKFGDDLPAYAAAVQRAGLPTGGRVLDAGCGTGRALPALRAAVGPAGTVIGLDLTPQMLDVARTRAEPLILGDARRLPFADAALDAIFAAGLVMHLPDPTEGLRELARATAPGGRLVLFHPSGRAALAARHGRTLRPDEPLSKAPLAASCHTAGWHLSDYDDAEDHFYALALRTGPARSGS